MTVSRASKNNCQHPIDLLRRVGSDRVKCGCCDRTFSKDPEVARRVSVDATRIVYRKVAP